MAQEAAARARSRRTELFPETGHRPPERSVAAKSTPTDPVTVADTETETFIRELLGRRRPGDAVLGEEAGGSAAAPAGVRWVVDPIDGTVNFLYGIPAYAVSVAAQVDGESVNPITDLSMALVATGFGYAPGRRRAQGELVAGLLPQVRDLRRVGAAALDLCMVASGAVDAHIEHGLSPWDWAAGGLIAAEAGARIVLPPADSRSDEGYPTIAAAPGIADRFLDVLDDLGGLRRLDA